MVSGDRSWDAEKLNRVPWPIRSVPLGNGSSGDTWIWHFDAKGTYKVYWTLDHFPPPTKMPMSMEEKSYGI